MKTTSGGGDRAAASARMPCRWLVVLPQILSLRSIQKAEGTAFIASRLSRVTPDALAIEPSKLVTSVGLT